MKIKKRNILLFLAVVTGLCFLGYYTFDQARDHLRKLDQTISQKELDLDLIKRDINNNMEYVAKWDSIKSFMDETPGDRLTAYGDFIISLETERNFDLQSTPEERPIPDNKEMQEIVFKLEFLSNITDLAEFLGRLDSEQNKLLQIKSLTVNYRGKSYRSGYTGYDKTDDKELSVTMVLAAPTKLVQNVEEAATFTGNLLK